MEPALRRFLDQLDLPREPVGAAMETVIAGLDWEDPLGELGAVEPGELLLCSTFGETVAEAVEVQVGRFTLRYPSPLQHRAASLHLVCPRFGLEASLDHLERALGAVDPALCGALALAGARARQPEGRFRWENRALAQAVEVVERVEQWPGQIALSAARRRDPGLAVGDRLWIEERSPAVPVVWVLDWLRG